MRTDSRIIPELLEKRLLARHESRGAEDPMSPAAEMSTRCRYASRITHVLSGLVSGCFVRRTCTYPVLPIPTRFFEASLPDPFICTPPVSRRYQINSYGGAWG